MGGLGGVDVVVEETEAVRLSEKQGCTPDGTEKNYLTRSKLLGSEMFRRILGCLALCLGKTVQPLTTPIHGPSLEWCLTHSKHICISINSFTNLSFFISSTPPVVAGTHQAA